MPFSWLTRAKQVSLLNMSALSFALSQPLKTLTMILSVCNRNSNVTPKDITNTLLYNKLNVREMIQTCSYNKSSLSTHVVPSIINVPCNGNTYYPVCDVFGWAEYADNFVSTYMRIPLTQYNRRIYIIPPDVGCGFGGLGSVGPCGNECRVWINSKIANEVSAYVHELGHTLGLSHASYMGDQYGDLTDIMGYCCNVRCFTAPNTFKLKWTKPQFQHDLPFQKPQTYAFYPNRYLVITDIRRQEYIIIHFRVPKKLKYDIDIIRGLNIYIMPFTQYSQTTLVTSLTQKGTGWYSTSAAYSVQLMQITDKTAVVLIQPTNLLPDVFDNVKIPV